MRTGIWALVLVAVLLLLEMRQQRTGLSLYTEIKRATISARSAGQNEEAPARPASGSFPAGIDSMYQEGTDMALDSLVKSQRSGQ